MFETRVLEKLKAHILYAVTPPAKKSAIYETMWKNGVEWGRPQMTVWCIHIVCWILQYHHHRWLYSPG